MGSDSSAAEEVEEEEVEGAGEREDEEEKAAKEGERRSASESAHSVELTVHCSELHEPAEYTTPADSRSTAPNRTATTTTAATS